MGCSLACKCSNKYLINAYRYFKALLLGSQLQIHLKWSYYYTCIISCSRLYNIYMYTQDILQDVRISLPLSAVRLMCQLATVYVLK